MNFYSFSSIDDLNNVISSGVDITTMSKVFKLMGKDPQFKYVDDANGYNIVHGANITFECDPAHGKAFKDKKLSFLVVKALSAFTAIDDKTNQTVWAGISNDKLFKSATEEGLNLRPTAVLDKLNHEEKKAYEWLETGRTGTSSKTMCGIIYPKVKALHASFNGHFKDEYNDSYPCDSGDFKRCMGFLAAVPEARAHLDKVAQINTKWNKLIEKWADIESLINNQDLKGAGDIIYQCIEKEKKLAP